MAEKDDASAGGEPTVGGSDWAKLSEFFPYGDSPPRLSAGINDALTDASETAVFAKMRKTKSKKPTPKKTGNAQPPPEYASAMETPQRDEVEDPYQADVVQAILDWVLPRLEAGLGAAWMTQFAQMIAWNPSDAPEEGWAQAITELFLGATYAGPGQTYQLGVPLMRNASGALVPLEKGKPAPDPIAWEPMLYRRIERKQWIRKGDRFGLKEWRDPVPFEEDGEAPNTDPAVAIGLACQHLSTYAVITRGIPVDAVGNWFAPGSGLAASDFSWGLPVFGGPRYSRMPMGQSETMAGYHLPKPPPTPKEGEPETKTKPEETISYYHDVQSAIAAGLGPGCVAIYDPDHGSEKSPPQIYMTEYEREKYGPSPVKIYAQYFRGRQGSEDSFDFTDNAWTKKDRAIMEAQKDICTQQDEVDTLKLREHRTPQGEADLQRAQARLAALVEEGKKDKGPRALVPNPGAQQYDGSHIYAILRKHPTKPLVQLFDVNAEGNREALTETGSDSIMTVQKDGVVDGCGRDKLYELSKGFAGLGILPPHRIDQAQVDFLRTARPVGLARMAVTRRLKTPGNMTGDDVLYVSRMIRLYGDKPDQNYTVARLLWSLRNTPGFTDIQVWWFVYAPRNLLAKAMWAHGARSMRLTDFASTHHAISAGDVLLAIVVANLANPGKEGHATFYCRFRSGASGGVTTTKFEPGDPPRALMRYTSVDALGLGRPGSTKPTLAWNESYVHPKIQVDEGRLPAIFQEGS
jgi:hypothetical protein